MKSKLLIFFPIVLITIAFTSCKQDSMFSLEHKYKLNKVYVGNETEIALSDIEKPTPLENKIRKTENKKNKVALNLPFELNKTTSNTVAVNELKKKGNSYDGASLKDKLLFKPVTRNLFKIAKQQTEKSKSVSSPNEILIWILIILGAVLILKILNIDLLQILGVILIILLILFVLKYLV